MARPLCFLIGYVNAVRAFVPMPTNIFDVSQALVGGLIIGMVIGLPCGEFNALKQWRDGGDK